MATVSPTMADVVHGIQTLMARLQKYEQSNRELDLRRENLESEILSVYHHIELEKRKQADLRAELAGTEAESVTHTHGKAKKSGIIGASKEIVEDKVSRAKCCTKTKAETGQTGVWTNSFQPSSEDHLHGRNENILQTREPVVNALPSTIFMSI
ncbi:hypothetical protein BD779DRAFT_243855 [Infundibulicybe gibba]|nr:hypothetical protein BD779DRAFT_243855 [Infundibulicybe gibba]